MRQEIPGRNVAAAKMAFPLESLGHLMGGLSAPKCLSFQSMWVRARRRRRAKPG